MAEESEGGIIQMVELQLDQATAEKLKASIQSALNDGTKSEGAVANLGKVEGGIKAVTSAAKELWAMLGELGVVLGFVELIKKVVEANAEYERLTVQVSAFTGSMDTARVAVAALEDIQRKVPVTLRDLTAAYVTLKNVGISPSSDQMLHFANIATATGRSVDDVASGVAMATLGMTRGLRQFGIQAVVDGDQLKLTFRGVTTEIQNNAQSIVDYLDKIGTDKYGDAAAAQADTLGGAWTMLKSAFDRLFEALGEEGVAGAIVSLLHWLTRLVDEWKEVEEKTKETGAVFGATADLIKGTVLVVFNIAVGVLEVLAGTLLEVQGALRSLFGDFKGGARDFADGLDMIAKAGGRLEAAYRAGSNAETSIQARRQALLVAQARAADDRDGLNNVPGNDPLGSGKAGGAPITKMTAEQVQKLLDTQKQLFAELVKESDERAKIAGITNKELGDYERRLALVRQESGIVQKQEQTLVQQLRNGNLSDDARKLVVAKLQTLVNQSKALQEEAARLLEMMRLRQPLAASNANNLPGAGGGLNAGVDAANNASMLGGGASAVGIMGMNSGMTPEQLGERGSNILEQHGKVVDKATAAVNRYRGAWDAAFLAIGAGKNVFKELEKAFGATIAAIAQKEAENQVAKGVAALAEGTWPPNPVALIAAGKHFAAAALFEVLAGAAGSVGQGGGGSGGSASANVGGSQTQNAKAMQPIITVNTYAFDPKSPVHQQYLGDAVSSWVERTGGKTVFGGTR